MERYNLNSSVLLLELSHVKTSNQLKLFLCFHQKSIMSWWSYENNRDTDKTQLIDLSVDLTL